MSLLFVLLASWIPSAGASAPACAQLFVKTGKPYVIQTTADQVFTTQSKIGLRYAWLKLLSRSGFSPDKKLEKLSKEDMRTLRMRAVDQLEEPIPAVIAPDGKYFIIDGHHDLYAAVLLGLDLSEVLVKLAIVKDYRNDKVTMTIFRDDVVARQWADEDFAPQNPKLISALGNSPERSLVGLVFMVISERYDIKMVGKYFVPRVQFKLVDFMTEKNLFEFNGVYDEASIEQFIQVMLANKNVIEFLVESMLPSAKPNLRLFLLSRL